MVLIKCGFKKKKKAYIDEFKYELRLMAQHFAEEIAKQFEESSISEEQKKIWLEGSAEDVLHSYVKIKKIECKGIDDYYATNR